MLQRTNTLVVHSANRAVTCKLSLSESVSIAQLGAVQCTIDLLLGAALLRQTICCAVVVTLLCYHAVRLSPVLVDYCTT
jgi:hypothetical protein